MKFVKSYSRALAVDDLDLVQHPAHLNRRELGVRQKIAKIVEGALEVDIVLPQRVVGVHDQILSLNDPHTPKDPLACPLVGAIGGAQS